MSVFRLTDVSNRDRETKEYWDARTAKEWDLSLHGLFGEERGLGHIATMDVRNFNVIADLLPRNRQYVHILECACGYGRYAKTIAGFDLNVDSIEYTGIDLAEKNIEEARWLNPYAGHHFFVADMAIFASSDRYDLIFMVAAWSSIEQNSAEIIAHLKTLLHPGGKIAIFEESLYLIIDGDK